MSAAPNTDAAPVRPPGVLQRLRTLFAPAKSVQPVDSVQSKRKSRPALLLLIVLALGAALLLFFKRRGAKSTSEPNEGPPVAEGIQQIRYWKRQGDWDSPLTMTLIETNGGLRMLDEADVAGNGVVTVYLPKSQKGGKRCFSLVRQKAIIYNRLTYEPLKTDCVTSYRIVKRDFKEQMPVTVSLRGLDHASFEAVIDYLKDKQVLGSAMTAWPTE